MRALVCQTLTGIDGIAVDHHRPCPVLRPGQVLVDVAAAGLNFPDLLMLSGGYQFKPEVPFVPGMEGAGTIAAVAPDVDRRAIGRRVMFSARSTFADYVAVDLPATMDIPATWSLEQAAAFPVIATTAWHALVHRAQLKAGERLLVHGASGGTGHMAVMLGKALGAHVVATTTSPAKLSALASLGADAIVDATAPDLAERLKSAAGGAIDVVFDPVGGAVFDASLKACGFGARLLIIGFTAAQPNQVRTNYALIKGLSILGVRAGEAARQDPRLAEDYRTQLPHLAATAAVKPHIGAVFQLQDGMDAFTAMQRRQVVGKIVLKP